MGSSSRIISIVTAMILAVSSAAEEIPLRQVPDFLPPDVERMLAEGEFELLSLDPALLTEKQRRRLGSKLFHGYRVLGRVNIPKGRDRDELLQALHESIKDSPLEYAYCFDPRHAIRTSLGTQVAELLICFECHRIEVYSPERSLTSIRATAQPSLDAALKRAGVPLGKRP
jgi:hypothetical protein